MWKLHIHILRLTGNLSQSPYEELNCSRSRITIVILKSQVFTLFKY